MFERYSEAARRVIFFARYEAAAVGSDYVEPEHVLLALLREDSKLRTMIPYAVRQQIRSEIEKAIPIREQLSATVDLPLSANSKRILAYSAEEAERLGQSRILPEHIGLGLLREPEGLPGRLLAKHGVTVEKLRELLASASAPHAASDNESIVRSLSASFDQIARRLTPEVEPATGFRLR